MSFLFCPLLLLIPLEMKGRGEWLSGASLPAARLNYDIHKDAIYYKALAFYLRA